MVLALSLVAAVILLGWLQVKHIRRVGLERRGALESAQAALEQPQLEQRGIDYPVLRGFYRGRRVTVSFIADTVALRALPTLWLSATVHRPLPLRGPIDILMRPSPTDIVSPGARFPSQHELPETWPAHVRLATPAGVLPPVRALDPVLPLLNDRRTKDVLLAPAGARLVTEAARAELGQFRLVRRSKFNVQITAATLAALLAALADMTDDLELAIPIGSA